jgi:hypothetical protein
MPLHGKLKDISYFFKNSSPEQIFLLLTSISMLHHFGETG